MSNFQSTKVIELGSCAFRQPNAHGTRCKLLHGYKLTAKFWFKCSELDDRNWVVNFGGLKDLKQILNDQFDHTLTVAANDPLLPLFKTLHDTGGCDLRIMENGVGIERVAEWCFNAADKYVRQSTNNRCWVDQVEVFEHELNSALFRTTEQQAVITPLVTPTTSESVEILCTAVETVSEVAPTPATTHVPQPVRVGPNVSSGKGDWFKGTSWGN